MTENNNEKYLTWIDVETFGLDVQADPLIEVGIRITNLDFVTVAELHSLVWLPNFSARILGADDWIKQTHEANGLFETARKYGHHPQYAEDELVKELKFHFAKIGLNKPPMVGSSVHFDRGVMKFWMPGVEKLFGYRNIDFSSIKELCKRYNPELYKRVDALKPRKLHRVLPDLDDSIDEAMFYTDNFIFDGRPVE